jgi:hypothetical protein
MTDKEVLEGNKLLADFDGIKIGVSLYSWRIGCQGPIQEKHLNYHASWGLLMPLVEKIEALPADDFHGHFCVFIGAGNNCTIQGSRLSTDPKNYHPAYFNDATLETKILSTWRVCVSFIKWYNGQNK